MTTVCLVLLLLLFLVVVVLSCGPGAAHMPDGLRYLIVDVHKVVMKVSVLGLRLTIYLGVWGFTFLNRFI